MEIALHEIEPWLIKYQFARFNLAESGVANLTVGGLMDRAGVTDAMLRAVPFDNADTRGSPALRKQVADLHPGAQVENVLVTTGTSEALWLYFAVRFTPGSNVVAVAPSFQSLIDTPRYQGFEVRVVELDRARNFELEVDEVIRKIDDATRVVVLNTPQNPTGQVLDANRLIPLFERAREVGAHVLVDEHYRFVPLSGDESLLPTLYGSHPSVIAVGSMIKCFGCVGLRVGWLVGPPPLLDSCRNMKDYTTHTVCSLNDLLAERALASWRTIMPPFLAWARENAAAFTEFVKENSDWLAWVPAQGGLVCFPWLTNTRRASMEYAVRLVEETEVFLLPGETFGRPGHFRLGFGVQPASFRIALDRWASFHKRFG